MNACYTLPNEASNAISHNLCHGCGLCAMNCPTGALIMERQEMSTEQSRNSPTFIPHLCVHCGRCAAVCPSGTIFQFRTEQLLQYVKEQHINTVVFMCENLNSSMQSCYEQGNIPLDMPLQDARKVPRLHEGLEIPPRCHLEIVRCTGRLGARFLLRMALQGVRTILIFACPPALCQYSHGRAGVAEHAQAFNAMLEQYAVYSVRVQVFQKSFASPKAFGKALAAALDTRSHK
ncbi:MAG: 4Fe-4S binding protein [Desulfovibrionaceae bacterium]